MRDVINKNHTEEELLLSVETAAREGYTSAKLYFMCGLPGETDDDLRAILDLAQKAWQRARDAGHRGFRITASVSPHVPKPHTPFAWAEQVSTAELKRRLGVLRDAARGKTVTLKYRDAETSLLEGVFTRGDRRLGLAVEEAFRRGCRFDAWTEHLKFETWMGVFRDLGLDPERQLVERSTELDQPWDLIQSPVTRKFLVREKLKADRAAITDDCRLEDVCFSCGVSDCPQRPWVKTPHVPVDLPRAHAAVSNGRAYGRRARASSASAGAASARGPGAASARSGGPFSSARALAASRSGASAPRGVSTSTRFRILFEKSAVMRFTSHLDLMRTWERALRRSGLPLAFTQGHHPHIRMSFGPPLPLGYRSRAEVFDLELTRPPAVDLAERLDAALPDGLRVVGFRPILFKNPSLMSQLEGATYRVRFPRPFLTEAGLSPDDLLGTLERRSSELLGQSHLVVRRRSETQAREFDARPSIVALEARSEEPPAVLDAHIRFTPRAVVRPEEVVAWLLPDHDVRTLDIERMALWTEVDGGRLDPLELLSKR
jgi:radical SAM-linked protein